MYPRSNHKKTPVTLLALSISLALAGTAVAQDAPTAATELDTVTVTGYRASVEKALDIKRGEAGVVDAVVAEDIGKFPDLNLAESLQRIPGVVIARDAGEGRSISVRGLGPEFTRVRINGMEALATVGSGDQTGGSNRGRGFDFNVFASDLFSQLIVRKTASADVEEGSLGATVDLNTARPFDYDGFTFAASGQASYNDMAQKAELHGVVERCQQLLAARERWIAVDVITHAASLGDRRYRHVPMPRPARTVQWHRPGFRGSGCGAAPVAATPVAR